MTNLLRLQLSCQSDDTVEVRVEQSPKGEPRHALESPFSPTAERGLLKILETPDLTRCRLEDNECRALRELGVIENDRLLGAEARNQLIGRQLFRALFPTSDDPDHDVRGALEAALVLAEQAGTSVPLQLRFDPDAVHLAVLPWELIYANGEHLVANGRLQFTRYITFGQSTAPFPITDRLEVLVITARPTDAKPLDPDAECRAIRGAFVGLEASHSLRVHLLNPPTLDALVSAVNQRPYHIVHFDGHGVFARRCPVCMQFQAAHRRICAAPDCSTRLQDAALEGCLAFERSPSDRTMHLVSATELATALHRQVRLCVVSACQSATVGGASVFCGVGPRLIRAGVPAVVAMQFSVPMQAAVSFVQEFYAALADEKPIAAAAAAGRRMLHGRGVWYIPAVYLRNRDGQGFLFRFRDSERVRGEIVGGANGTRIYLRPAGAPALDWAALRSREAAPYKFLSSYDAADASVFYGRDTEVQALKAEILHQPLMVLHGPPGAGKSSLIHAGLIPALLQEGYLALVVQGDDDPLERLCQAVTASSALDVDVSKVEDLEGLIAVLARDICRPLLLVLDDFGALLRTADVARRTAFLTQIRNCVQATHPLPVSLLLVVRQVDVGCLQALELLAATVPGRLFALNPMTPEQAEQAITGPLGEHLPPLKVDPRFLHATLLPDLVAEPGQPTIDPTHLQIVCHELYQAARKNGTAVIDHELYPKGGVQTILGRYLEQAIDQCCREPEEQVLACKLLKQMVSPSGERVFVPVDALTQAAEVESTQAQDMLDALGRQGLLERRATPEQADLYSVSQHIVAAKVQRWFDRDESLARCAQEALNRAWADWYARWYSVPRDRSESAGDVRALLVEPDRLREIRRWRSKLTITGPQYCLLLQSAVRHGTDIEYWAKQLENTPEVKSLLRQVQRGVGESRADQVSQAAEALGLPQGDVGEMALARAAFSDHDRTLRHTTALALAALGLDEVNIALTARLAIRLESKRWLPVQSLAWMTGAGFTLPQLPLGLLAQVYAWATGIRLYADRWRLLWQATCASWGGGLGLMLITALAYRPWPLDRDKWAVIVSSLIVGVLVGAAFAAGRWALDVLRTHPVGRVLGGAVGFLGGLAFWFPLSEMQAWQLLAGPLAGAAIVSGWEGMCPRGRNSEPAHAALGGAIGGAVGFVAAKLLGMSLPFVLKGDVFSYVWKLDRPWLWVGGYLVPALFGAAMGAGLAGGAAAGQALWNRFVEREQEPAQATVCAEDPHEH